jgi:hypothetical protein
VFDGCELWGKICGKQRAAFDRKTQLKAKGRKILCQLERFGAKKV